MKKNIERIVEAPKGILISLNGDEVKVSGNGKELKRSFRLPDVTMKIEDGKLKIFAKNASKREGKLIGTAEAHVKNMIEGIQKDYIYKLEIANVHFPMNVKVEGNRLIIKSFLGESVDRQAKILANVKVNVKGSEIEVSSSDVESAGQTAANIEKAARLTGRDRRIFQDGIFITQKPGEEK